MTAWLGVIGIGEDGPDALGGDARRLLARAELLIGGERHLHMILEADCPAERLVWGQPLAKTIGHILDRRGRPTVVLASGDPMHYGVGATLSRYVPPNEMIVLPQPSAFSWAAARMGWALQDVQLITLHGRPLDGLSRLLAPGMRILALSEDGATPFRVAAWLRQRGWGATKVTVLEHLGGSKEARWAETAANLPERHAADLNTLALECSADIGIIAYSLRGSLPDDAFRHDGQLTKRAIRAATLASLAPLAAETLWDIGAGSGSVAIEWLRTDDTMKAVAIERSVERCAMIAANAAALGVPGLRIVQGSAPAALAGLPQPQAVFIGGGVEDDLISYCWEALTPKGRLVANAVTLEGEAVLYKAYQRLGGDLTRLCVSRVEKLAQHHAWRPAMPVTQFVVTKPALSNPV